RHSNRPSAPARGNSVMGHWVTAMTALCCAGQVGCELVGKLERLAARALCSESGPVTECARLGAMPWIPELFSEPALERIRREAAEERAAEPVPYFDGIRTGETEALIGSFAGEPELNHPVWGRVTGRRAFEGFVPE